MNSLRALYDRLPDQTRRDLRSWVPDPILRWYAHRKTQVYLISYPKCGRTWLRLMIGQAIAAHFGLPQTEETLFIRWKEKPHPQAPHITVIHDDRPMLKTPGELETNKKRYQSKRVIFLTRDPRDVIVSSYFEMKNRGMLFGDNPYEQRKAVFDGSLPEFIHRRQGGFETILAYYNIWAQNRDRLAGFLLVRYEDMKTDPHQQLRRVVDFLGLTAIPDATLAQAVEFASFENMRKMETQGKFNSGILNPADQQNVETYKTRKGLVKGYLDYLDEPEIAFMNSRIETQLSPLFGYAV
ncbi:MAG: hypothetical protein B6D39_05660 [Anaerolineae bacterium UTCFX2]|jgi:hypothetical protein|nr:sulfotransferase domain-containing protein [Anaerolineales bacterium]OQY91853.1 MAG: hypothetical protein B6D39_05660 [Anaerolineae bacterium UTCFX2]